MKAETSARIPVSSLMVLKNPKTQRNKKVQHPPPFHFKGVLDDLKKMLRKQWWRKRVTFFFFLREYSAYIAHSEYRMKESPFQWQYIYWKLRHKPEIMILMYQDMLFESLYIRNQITS